MSECVVALSDGSPVLVDPVDHEYLTQWKWKRHRDGYAVRSGWKNGKFVSVYMHREIMNPPEGLEVDHINRDKLDNRRENLRSVSRSVNMHNHPNRVNRTSGRRGVSWHKASRKWWARIYVDTKLHDLGMFDDIEEAGESYDKARIRLVEKSETETKTTVIRVVGVDAAAI